MNRRNEIKFKVLFIVFIFSLLLFALLAFRSCGLITKTVDQLEAKRTIEMDITKYQNKEEVP